MDWSISSDTGGVSGGKHFGRRHFLKLGGTGAAAFALGSAAGCQGGAASGGGGASGQVRFLVAENFWADWEPYQSTAQSQARLERQIFDYLVEFPSGDLTRPKPALATSWEQTSDDTWEFRLRDDVSFHDGQRFRAADVKASVERASGASDVETISSQYWVPTTVEVVDDHTVRLRTEQPFAALLGQLGDTPIYSARDFESGKELTRAPNGTGPFKLNAETATRKTMVVNRRYWRQRARISRLVWEFVQDPQTRLNALVAGQAQAIDRVPPEHLSVIENNADLRLSSVTGIESVNLWVVPGRNRLWDTNRAFRQAVSWSIDREALVKNLVQGESVAATSFMPQPVTAFHEPQSPKYTFDPRKAKALLEEAGVPDGGPEFELWAATGFLPRAKQVVEAISNNMKQVGIKPKIVTSDVSGLIDDTESKNGSGMMYHLSWSGNGDPHRSMVVYGTQYKWSTDDRLEDLITRGMTAVDQGERRSVYAKLQQYMWEQVPHVPLYNSDFSIAHTAALEGLQVLPNFKTVFYPARLMES